MSTYRIRWARVYGTWVGSRRMCIAERRTWVFGFIPMWWPVENGNWRHDESEAKSDIAIDRDLQQPLPDPRYFFHD